MPVGDCQRALQQAAADDGVPLVSRKHAWLTQRGHCALPPEASEARTLLREIFKALGGDEMLLAAGRTTTLTGDYFHDASRTLVEVDEIQHFTSARLLSLSLYPPGQVLGFNLDEYRTLCEEHRAKADRAFAHKAATAFGPRGRQRQRAYNDALRDIAASALGHPGVVRAPAIHQNGRMAWLTVRQRFPHEPSGP
jgi:hypothetical protein